MNVRVRTAAPFILLSILLMRLLPVLGLYLLSGDAVLNTGEADPLLYLGGARSILTSGVNEFPFFPPLQFLFIAGLLHVAGGNVVVPVLATVCVGWCTVFVLYFLARELFDERTALITALLAGCYPNFIFYGMNLYPETLAIFFITCSFFLLVRYFKTQNLIYAACAGIIWGLASQTRGGLHLFAPGIAVALVWHARGRGWMQCLKPVAAACVGIYSVVFAIGFMASPFYGGMSMNSRSGMGSALHGANRLINCNPDYGQARGSIFYSIHEAGEPWPEGVQVYSNALMEQDTATIIKAFAAFIWENPFHYLRNGFERMSFLWSPNQLIIKFLKLRVHHHFPRVVDAVCLSVSLIFVFVVSAGTLGVSVARDPLRPLFLMFVAFYCLLIFFTVGNAKLRLPLMPFVMLYAGYFCSQLAGRRAGLTKKAAVWSGVLCGLIIVNSAYRYNQNIALSPGECNVRQVEMSVELGFPKTAGFLLEKNKNFQHYTEQQRTRLNDVARRLHAGGQND